MLVECRRHPDAHGTLIVIFSRGYAVRTIIGYLSAGRHALLLGFMMLVAGCATPGVGLDTTTTSIDAYLKSQPAPPSDRVRVVVYRDSGFVGSLAGVILEADGREVITIANKKYSSLLLQPGPKEFTVSFAVPGNPKCTRTLFISPGEMSFLKIGERAEYSKGLAILSPLASLIKENNDEDKSRCGGSMEPFLIKPADAMREINSLR